MTFQSILSESGKETKEENVPQFFGDLNLDKVLDAITSGREEYALRPFFLAQLRSAEEIKFRHEVLQDLERADVHGAVESFARRMRKMREDLELANRLPYKLNSKGWLVSAVEAYCEAVEGLASELANKPKSRGLSAFLEYLKGYAESPTFRSLASDTRKLRGDLSAVKYSILIDEEEFTVRKYDGEPDYGEEMERVFEKFRQGEGADYRVQFSEGPGMNHIQDAAAFFVAQLYPAVFKDLDDFCVEHASFIDKTVARFDREVQFYVAYLDLMGRLKEAGLHFSYPVVSESKEVESVKGFDLALAIKLVGEKHPVVTNDFSLRGAERIFVVNGPNQGGKTTFARAFGQLHYLASLGYPVPGTEARLFLSDRLFTHFAQEEDIENLRSKLEDDLVRIRSILDQATPGSLIIINEEFSSSTLHDAAFLGRKVLERVIRLDALCVYVTFVDELSSLEKAVSLMSSVSPADPAVRTYKIVRRQPDGVAHALAIAKMHQLTYENVKERIPG